MNKAFFLDLDGTLLNDKNKITNKTKETLLKAKNNNWDIILSTGKSFKNSIHYYKELNLDFHMIHSQGQVISKNNEIIYSIYMDINNINFVCNKYKKEIINFLIETLDEVYVLKKDTIINEFIKNKKISYFNKNMTIKNIIGFYIEVNQNFILNYKLLDFYEWDIMLKNKIIYFKPLGISKLSSLKIIQKIMNYTRIISIGNGRNDIDVLKYSDIGIAMKSSQPDVLKEISNISEFDNNNNGAAKEIDKIIKLENTKEGILWKK